ncbi:MAG: ACP S-malonyltransferase, partial [Bacteroidales bacterium]|nr:ACP S-malonyltransferase [Bacteroidales bacterium]
KAYVFPGQGSQFPGMGKDLYENSAAARAVFDKAGEVLGFDIVKIMFEGSDEQLRETSVTQPSIFIHSVAAARAIEDFTPDMVAGHSLGEFSALVASGALGYEDALRLVAARANAMNEACRQNPGKMAAIINLDDATVRKICDETEGIVVPANFNSPGQVVISGEADAIDRACKAAKAAGAKRALPLPVGGAFHSPLMEPARAALAKAIDLTQFGAPICPIFQNVDSLPHTDPAEIKANLIAQLTGPVLWSQSVLNMHQAGATDFTELGPGSVLTNLIGRIIG